MEKPHISWWLMDFRLKSTLELPNKKMQCTRSISIHFPTQWLWEFFFSKISLLKEIFLIWLKKEWIKFVLDDMHFFELKTNGRTRFFCSVSIETHFYFRNIFHTALLIVQFVTLFSVPQILFFFCSAFTGLCEIELNFYFKSNQKPLKLN